MADGSAPAKPPVSAAVSAVVRDVERRHVRGEEVVIALRGLSMEVRRGELLFVMGPSGSGKSTLLHLLGGLDRPTRGEVLLAAHHFNDDRHDGALVNLAELDDEALARLRRTEVGFVFQSFNLLPTLSSVENVALPLILDGRSEADARRRALELLEAVGVAHRQHHVPEELSGGERQRVAIARALAPDPSLILADEPTGNLDSAQGRVVHELLRRLARDEHRTVVVVTHDETVASLADRVLHLRDGGLEDAVS